MYIVHRGQKRIFQLKKEEEEDKTIE